MGGEEFGLSGENEEFGLNGIVYEEWGAVNNALLEYARDFVCVRFEHRLLVLLLAVSRTLRHDSCVIVLDFLLLVNLTEEMTIALADLEVDLISNVRIHSVII